MAGVLLVYILVTFLSLETASGAVNQTDGETEAVTVDLTATGPQELNEGSTLILTCTVNGSYDESRDKIVFQKSEMITLPDQSDRAPDAPDNFIQDPNNANQFIILFKNISRNDRGDYICKVLRLEDDEYKTIAEKTYTVNVFYTSNSKPSCEIKPAKQSYYEGDGVTLKCISDAGFPPVPVQWSASQQDDLALEDRRSSEQDGNTVLVWPILLTPNMNGVTFDCVKQGVANVSSDQSCSVGPLKVSNNSFAPFGPNAVDPAGNSNDVSIYAIVGAVVGITVVVAITVIVVVVKSKRGGQGTQTRKRRAISGPVDNYDRLPTVENGDANPSTGAASGDSHVMAVKSKKKPSKTYPDPPSYPRPFKDPNIGKVKPYANTEISPDAKNKDGKPKTTVYANTLDVGSGDASNKTESAKLPREKKEEPEIYEPVLVPPSPPDEASRNP